MRRLKSSGKEHSGKTTTKYYDPSSEYVISVNYGVMCFC